MEPKQPKYSKDPPVRRIIQIEQVVQPTLNPFIRTGLYNLTNGTNVIPRFGAGPESNAFLDYLDRNGLPYPDSPIGKPLA
jgi:hypothetical protein